MFRTVHCRLDGTMPRGSFFIVSAKRAVSIFFFPRAMGPGPGHGPGSANSDRIRGFSARGQRPRYLPPIDGGGPVLGHGPGPGPGLGQGHGLGGGRLFRGCGRGSDHGDRPGSRWDDGGRSMGMGLGPGIGPGRRDHERDRPPPLVDTRMTQGQCARRQGDNARDR